MNTELPLAQMSAYSRTRKVYVTRTQKLHISVSLPVGSSFVGYLVPNHVLGASEDINSRGVVMPFLYRLAPTGTDQSATTLVQTLPQGPNIFSGLTSMKIKGSNYAFNCRAAEARISVVRTDKFQQKPMIRVYNSTQNGAQLADPADAEEWYEHALCDENTLTHKMGPSIGGALPFEAACVCDQARLCYAPIVLEGRDEYLKGRAITATNPNHHDVNANNISVVEITNQTDKAMTVQVFTTAHYAIPVAGNSLNGALEEHQERVEQDTGACLPLAGCGDSPAAVAADQAGRVSALARPEAREGMSLALKALSSIPAFKHQSNGVTPLTHGAQLGTVTPAHTDAAKSKKMSSWDKLRAGLSKVGKFVASHVPDAIEAGEMLLAVA